MSEWTKKRPKCCHVKNGGLYLVKKNKWTMISRIEQGESVFYENYSRMISTKKGTLGHIMIEFKKHKLPGYAKSTQREYTRIIDRVLIPTYGKFMPAQIEPRHVGEHLEAALEAGSPVAGNREMAVLGSVYQYAIRLGECNYSPTKGVSRNTERARTRYVDDVEFYEHFERAPVQVQHMVMATYLTSLRQGSLRALIIDLALTDEGLRADESKDGKRMLIKWTPLLRQLVNDAKARSRCEHLFTNSKGQRWRLSSIQTALTRWNAPFTFHDLRAKAESDSESGFNLLSRYNRLRVVEAVR